MACNAWNIYYLILAKIFADPLSSTHTQINTEYKIWLEKDWYGGLCALAGSRLKWTTSFFLKKIIYLHRVLVAACGIQFPDQGTLLAPGSPGNSLSGFLTRAVIDHYPPPPLPWMITFCSSALSFFSSYACFSPPPCLQNQQILFVLWQKEQLQG